MEGWLAGWLNGVSMKLGAHTDCGVHVMTTCNVVCHHERFGGTRCFCLQGESYF